MTNTASSASEFSGVRTEVFTVFLRVVVFFGADVYKRQVSKVEYAKEDFVLSKCTFGRKTQQDPYTSDVLHSTGTVSERRQKCYDKRTEKS